MFDISFGELLVVFVLGLIVLGPQRLPVAVKTVAGWVRALRSLASSVQNELAHELKLQELQDSMKKVEKASMGNLTPELKASMDELREAAESMKRAYSAPLDPEKESDEAHTIHNPTMAKKPSEEVSPPVTATETETASQPVAQETALSPASETPSVSKEVSQTVPAPETIKSPEPTQPSSEKP